MCDAVVADEAREVRYWPKAALIEEDLAKNSTNMRIPGSTWLVAIACFISCAAFVARPAGDRQLAWIASSIVAIALLVGLVAQGAIKWRKRGMRNFISCLLIVAAFPAGAVTGRMVRSLQLSHDLERYNAAAQWVLAQGSPDSTNRIALPSHYADLGYAVYYERDELCGTRIDFVWGAAFPVKHIVRRYATDRQWTSIEACYRDWTRIAPIATNWYEISD